MTWDIQKHILYPATPGRTIQQSVWDIMGDEITGKYRDPHKSLAADVIREAVRTCAIPPKTLLAVRAFGHWYGSPLDPTIPHSPFSFHIQVQEIPVSNDGN